MVSARWYELPKKVRIVSEEPPLRRALESGFQRTAQEIRAASGVVQALNWMAPTVGREGTVWSPDAIICQWKMTGYDGLELLYLTRYELALTDTVFVLRVNRNPLYHALPFLEGLNLRADLYVENPYQITEIVRGVIGLWEEQARRGV
jgi:DNA-binding response OmpR family regulator